MKSIPTSWPTYSTASHSRKILWPFGGVDPFDDPDDDDDYEDPDI